jgi:hypothetical protein
VNVVIDSMRAAPGARALWWIGFACVVAGGLAMRLVTIDRNTPSIGVFVYFGLLAVVVLLIAMPAAVAGAWVWHQSLHRKWLAPLRQLGGDQRARWAVIALTIVATLLFASAGGRLPPWHVWLSAISANALVTWRFFPLLLSELRRGHTMSRASGHA